MSDAKNQLATQRELLALFRNVPGEGTGPTGRYLDLVGEQPRSVAGDSEAPWLKTPPFLTNPTPWETAIAVPNSAAYLALSAVECNPYRIISVDFSLELGVIAENSFGAQLSIVPEKRGIDRNGEVSWVALGVVNPSLSAVSLTGFGNGFGSRTVYPSELRTFAFTSNVARTVQFNLQWDVTGFDAFRLNLLQLTQLGQDENAVLDVFYQLAQ